MDTKHSLNKRRQAAHSRFLKARPSAPNVREALTHISPSTLVFAAATILFLVGQGRAGASLDKIMSSQSQCSAIRIVVFQDKTGSTARTRTAQITADDLAPLFETICRCGGELAFGLIRDRSNRSLLRIAIDAPPGEPSPPVWEHNPFRKQQQKEKYDRDLAVYQAAHNAWRGRTELKTQAFRTDLSSLLAQNADAPTTDIWSALHRADIFLSERDTVWGGGSVRWAVFITDGEDTSRSAPAPNFTSGARLVVVNGAGSLGVLGRFNPLVFESPAAAFHHIATTSGNLP